MSPTFHQFCEMQHDVSVGYPTPKTHKIYTSLDVFKLFQCKIMSLLDENHSQNHTIFFKFSSKSFFFTLTCGRHRDRQIISTSLHLGQPNRDFVLLTQHRLRFWIIDQTKMLILGLRYSQLLSANVFTHSRHPSQSYKIWICLNSMSPDYFCKVHQNLVNFPKNEMKDKVGSILLKVWFLFLGESKWW